MEVQNGFIKLKKSLLGYLQMKFLQTIKVEEFKEILEAIPKIKVNDRRSSFP